MKLSKVSIQPGYLSLAMLTVMGVVAYGSICLANPAALTDGVRQVTEQLYDCPVQQGASIRQHVRSANVDLRLRQLVRENVVTHWIDAQPITSNGTATSTSTKRYARAVVQLAVVDLIGALNKSAVDADLKQLLEQIANRQFVALGIAAPDTFLGAAHPSGWETVTSDGIAMAADIARDDALRQIDAAITQHASESDAVSRERRDALKSSVASIAPTMHAGQVCTINVPFEIGGVQYKAVGFGLPPWREVWTWSNSDAPEPPAWANQTLVATGKGATNANEIDERKIEIARSTATADALIKIATKVDELTLSDETVGQWLKRSGKYDALWSAYLHTAHPSVIEIDVENGICTVSMSLELERLWQLIVAVSYAENDVPQLARPNVR